MSRKRTFTGIALFGFVSFLAIWVISANFATAVGTFVILFSLFSLVHGYPKQFHTFGSVAFRIIVMSVAPVLLYVAFGNSVNLTLKQADKFVFVDGVITKFGFLYHFGFHATAAIAMTACYFGILKLMQMFERHNKD